MNILESIPEAVFIHLLQWLDGIDLSLLQFTNKYFQRILKDRVGDELVLIDYGDLALYFNNNTSLNTIIIETRPVCSYKYTVRFRHFNSEDDFYPELPDPDTGIVNFNDSDVCKGTVFIDPDAEETSPGHGKHWCEECMTEYHGVGWKDRGLKIAKNTRHYIKIKDVEVLEEFDPRERYHPILREYINEDIHVYIGEKVYFNNGRLDIFNEYYYHYNQKNPSLIINKREYNYDNTLIYVSKRVTETSE